MGGRFGLQPALRSGSVFHILVVDDDRAGAEFLRMVMKNLRGRYELHFAWDGIEALDLLHRKGVHQDAPRPNLVLLDLNMPGLGGIETLSAIKSDPELYVIPVIIFSNSSTPEDVRESYRAHANCFVQKPIDLERSLKLLQTIETFWLDFVLLPASGTPIASPSAEASSRTMNRTDYSEKKKIASHSGCTEHNRLLDDFGRAVRELLGLHEEQFLSIIDGDGECSRFDLLIHMANEHKQLAKYAYLRHVEAHGCAKT